MGNTAGLFCSAVQHTGPESKGFELQWAYFLPLSLSLLPAAYSGQNQSRHVSVIYHQPWKSQPRQGLQDVSTLL